LDEKPETAAECEKGCGRNREIQKKGCVDLITPERTPRATEEGLGGKVRRTGGECQSGCAAKKNKYIHLRSAGG